MLIQANAEWVKRKKKDQSTTYMTKLVRDLKDLVKYFNGDWNLEVQHYCAERIALPDGSEKVVRMCEVGKCLDNLCRVKKIALLRHRARPPTDKDWLALRTAQCWSEIGLSLHGMLRRAVVEVCEAEPSQGVAVQAHDAAAHPEGRARIQGARIKDSRNHFADPWTHVVNRIILICTEQPQHFIYELLKSPSVHSMLDPDQSLLGILLTQLTMLLDSWGDPQSKWSLLYDLKPDAQHDDDCIHLARRYLTSMQSSVIKSFWDECYGIDPYNLYILRSAKFSPQERHQRAVEVVQFPCCAARFCGRNIIDLARSDPIRLQDKFSTATIEMVQDTADHGGDHDGHALSQKIPIINFALDFKCCRLVLAVKLSNKIRNVYCCP
jgi:hypothetical protein